MDGSLFIPSVHVRYHCSPIIHFKLQLMMQNRSDSHGLRCDKDLAEELTSRRPQHKRKTRKDDGRSTGQAAMQSPLIEKYQ